MDKGKAGMTAPPFPIPLLDQGTAGTDPLGGSASEAGPSKHTFTSPDILHMLLTQLQDIRAEIVAEQLDPQALRDSLNKEEVPPTNAYKTDRGGGGGVRS